MQHARGSIELLLPIPTCDPSRVNRSSCTLASPSHLLWDALYSRANGCISTRLRPIRAGARRVSAVLGAAGHEGEGGPVLPWCHVRGPLAALAPSSLSESLAAKTPRSTHPGLCSISHGTDARARVPASCVVRRASYSCVWLTGLMLHTPLRARLCLCLHPTFPQERSTAQQVEGWLRALGVVKHARCWKSLTTNTPRPTSASVVGMVIGEASVRVAEATKKGAKRRRKWEGRMNVVG
ncbi:hypothetical protein B0H12DRAFT_1242624 [Mycena haematopus]|nr:hypothetical protein B0H12DRAFT_1242624 [Mycena haematopus]